MYKWGTENVMPVQPHLMFSRLGLREVERPGLEHAAALSGLVLPGEGRLVQVFRNLLENAVSFSPEGGTITVLIRREADKIVVVIEDEGVGFPISGLERVFERFYTDRPDMTMGDGHSGLGLSISRQIVEAYGGTIEAENRYAVESAAAVDTEPQPIGARLIVKLRPY